MKDEISVEERYRRYSGRVDALLSELNKANTALELETPTTPGVGSVKAVKIANSILISMAGLLKEMLEIAIPGLVLKNSPFVSTGQLIVTTAGTAEQLPPVEIPYGKTVAIKALSSNTDTVYIGNSKLEAEDHSMGFPFEGGEAVELHIDNLHQLWVDADVSGEGISWIVEKD